MSSHSYGIGAIDLLTFLTIAERVAFSSNKLNWKNMCSTKIDQVKWTEKQRMVKKQKKKHTESTKNQEFVKTTKWLNWDTHRKCGHKKSEQRWQFWKKTNITSK